LGKKKGEVEIVSVFEFRWGFTIVERARRVGVEIERREKRDATHMVTA